MFWKKGPKYNVQNNDMFWEAVEKDDRTKIEELVGFGIDPEILDKAFISCCKSGKMDLASYLITLGANIDTIVEPYSGTTLLLDACKEERNELAFYLCDKGANPNVLDKVDLCTPLFIACHHDDDKLVKKLIDAGAKVNTRCYNKETALLRSSWCASLECVKHLVEAGANIKLKDADGKNAIRLAKGNNRTEIIDYLQSL